MKLKKGENRFRFQQTIEQGGLTPITARLRGYKDTLLDNNSDFGLVFTAGKPRVLLVESDPDQAKHLTWALEEQDMQVDVRPPQGHARHPGRPPELRAADPLERAGHGADACGRWRWPGPTSRTSAAA